MSLSSAAAATRCISIADTLQRFSKNVKGHESKIVELLRELDGIQMTVEILQSTKLGILLNNIIRKQLNTENQALVKQLIAKWKQMATVTAAGHKAVSQQSTVTTPTPAPTTASAPVSSPAPAESSPHSTATAPSRPPLPPVTATAEPLTASLSPYQSVADNYKPAVPAAHNTPSRSTTPNAINISPPPTLTYNPNRHVADWHAAVGKQQQAAAGRETIDVTSRKRKLHSVEEFTALTPSATSRAPVHLCSLQDMCVDYMISRVSELTYLAELPGEIILRVLANVGEVELSRIEKLNPQICDATDELWREICLRKNSNITAAHKPRDVCWRDFNSELVKQKEARMANIGAKLRAKQENLRNEKSESAIKSLDMRAATRVVNKAHTARSSKPVLQMPGPNGVVPNTSIINGKKQPSKLHSLMKESSKITRSVFAGSR